MNQPTRSDLLKAVILIRKWHDGDIKKLNGSEFRSYYNQSTDMKFIRDVLGEFDEMKDEVIEATSVTVKKITIDVNYEYNFNYSKRNWLQRIIDGLNPFKGIRVIGGPGAGRMYRGADELKKSKIIN